MQLDMLWNRVTDKGLGVPAEHFYPKIYQRDDIKTLELH